MMNLFFSREQWDALQKHAPQIVDSINRNHKDGEIGQAALKRMKAMNSAAEADDRGFSDSEQAAWEALDELVERANTPAFGSDEWKRQHAAGNYYGADVETWQTRDGQQIPVLKPEQRFADHVQADPIREDVTFGSVVRAMVLGPRNEAERRALSEGTDSAGGYTVPTALSNQLIDKLRARATVIQAGARTVPLTTEQTSMARLATDPTASWHTENAQETATDPTFEGVTFTARTLMSIVRASRELLEDSVNIDEALSGAFAGALAGEVDRAALLGSGTPPEPQGISNQSGVLSVDMGTNGAAITDFSPFVTALQSLADNDLSVGARLTAVMAPRTFFTVTSFTTATEGQPLMPVLCMMPQEWNLGDAVWVPQLTHSSKMPVNETHGTATDASRIIMGDFSQCMIGVRSQLRIEVLRERYADYHQYGFVAHLRTDIQLAHPESFVQIEGIIP